MSIYIESRRKNDTHTDMCVTTEQKMPRQNSVENKQKKSISDERLCPDKLFWPRRCHTKLQKSVNHIRDCREFFNARGNSKHIEPVDVLCISTENKNTHKNQAIKIFIGILSTNAFVFTFSFRIFFLLSSLLSTLAVFPIRFISCVGFIFFLFSRSFSTFH